MVVRRGHIWWADLEEPLRSGPGFRRPVLVIQADVFNESGINTAIVAIISGNERLADAPGNVFLPTKLSGLKRDSVVNVSQLFTVDRSLLTDYVATLPPHLVRVVDDGLRLILAL
ncbi:MAG TPA: type II toxin-antitoxin system PemK/MazF family toxin [Bryobacteraceae bacterium]|jgi:mRNA interferase MazF